MDLRPNEFQQLLQNSAADFLEREVPADRVRGIEQAGVADQALWREIVDLGWTALPVEEAYGGSGGSLLDASVLIEQFCRAAAPTGFTEVLMAASTIQRYAPADVKQSVLPGVAAGEIIVPAFLEPADDLYATPATRVAGNRCTGEKRFVAHGESAGRFLVSAVNESGPGLAIVSASASGVSTAPMTTIGGTPMRVVSFKDAPVEGWIAGAAAIEYLRSIGAALTALESYAYAQKALDMTVEYVQMRVQFGQPIGAFQAVQNRVADVAIQVEAAKFLSRELLWNFDQGTIDPQQVAIVKAMTANAAPQVAMECHLLHGGIGYMQEYPLQTYTRRIKESTLSWGSTREMLNRVADAVLA